MELPGEAAAAERRRRAWIYRAYVSSPQQELHKAGAVVRLSSILARSPRWVLQRDDAISPDFVVALSWWARWGALEEKNLRGGKGDPYEPEPARGESGIGDDQEMVLILGTDRLSAAAAAVFPQALLAGHAEQGERRPVASP